MLKGAAVSYSGVATVPTICGSCPQSLHGCTPILHEALNKVVDNFAELKDSAPDGPGEFFPSQWKKRLGIHSLAQPPQLSHIAR